jgi:predicted transcriptional regulator
MAEKSQGLIDVVENDGSRKIVELLKKVGE